MSELLYYGGLALIGIDVVLAVAAAIFFLIRGKNLRKRLNAEYGKKDNGR
jgi:NhaP-type Na+/H+ and K+/H+ antiporter